MDSGALAVKVSDHFGTERRPGTSAVFVGHERPALFPLRYPPVSPVSVRCGLLHRMLSARRQVSAAMAWFPDGERPQDGEATVPMNEAQVAEQALGMCDAISVLSSGRLCIISVACTRPGVR